METTRSATPPEQKDDTLTLIAIAALVCVIGDVFHEGLGHGVTAWLSGAHHVTVSTVAMQSDIDTRLISAAGTLANLFFGAVFWVLLRRRYRPSLRYFFVLAMAGNLFAGTGYFLFSGVSNFGDWADVIRGQHPQWAWRVGLIVVGVVSYYASMLLVRSELWTFREFNPQVRRMRGLCWTPYFTEAVLAAISGVLNPIGFVMVIESALPSTLGANAGLLSLPSMMRGRRMVDDKAGPILRSAGWILTGVVASLIFVFVLGRGITWSH